MVSPLPQEQQRGAGQQHVFAPAVHPLSPSRGPSGGLGPRLRALQQRHIHNLPYCRDCFCKWHCAGDCLAKVFELSGSTEHQGSHRCRLNRSLTAVRLNEIASAAIGPRLAEAPPPRPVQESTS